MTHSITQSFAMIHNSSKSTSVDYVTVLLQYVQFRGFDTSSLLSAANIDQNVIADANSYISTEQYKCLLNAAVTLLEEPSLALALGQRQHLATHGALGYAIMSAGNIEQALNLVTRFIRTRSRLIRFNFFFDAEHAVAQIEVKHPIDALYRYCVEIAFTSIVSICQSLTQKPPQPCYLSVRYAQPSYHQEYASIFQSQAQFNAEQNELRIPLSWFEDVNLIGNPVFAELAQKQCEELLLTLEHQNSLTEQVKALLMQRSAYMPNQEETAIQLGLSARTLSRQLAKEQTSFKSILDALRQQLAKEYLNRNDSSIEDVAYLLGYESPPNFSRAFKRWTGLSPQQFRLNQTI